MIGLMGRDEEEGDEEEGGDDVGELSGDSLPLPPLVAPGGMSIFMDCRKPEALP